MLPLQILTIPSVLAAGTPISLHSDFFSLPQPQPQVKPEAEPTLAMSGMEPARTLAVSELYVWFGQEACTC